MTAATLERPACTCAASHFAESGDSPNAGSRGIEDPSLAAVPPEAPAVARWRGPLAMENEVTGDMPRRVFKPNALYWDAEETLPLSIVRLSAVGHDNSVVVGRIEELTRQPGGVLFGRGDFDMGNPDGVEAERLVREGRMNWASVDLDDIQVEVWVLKDLLASEEEGLGMLLASAAGDPMPSPDDYETVMELTPDDEIHVIRSARVRGATLVSISAFAKAKIEKDDEGATEEPDVEDEDESLVAAGTVAKRRIGIPVDPPVAWFADPQLPERPGGVQVSDDGRFAARVANWDTCHISFTGQGECIVPPHSASDYAYYRTGSVQTAEGVIVYTGRITMSTGHASTHPSTTAMQAIAHYENTGLAVADVTAGEDQYGIWVAGALRPGTTPEQIRTLRGSPLSGDWRTIAGNLEMVAALGVNTGGFPIPKPQALVASGRVLSLVAAGMERGQVPVEAPASVARMAARIRVARMAAKLASAS